MQVVGSCFFANLTILTPYRENAVVAAYNCYSYTKKYSTFKQFMTSVTVTVKTDSARCFCFTFRLMEFHANATKNRKVKVLIQGNLAGDR